MSWKRLTCSRLCCNEPHYTAVSSNHFYVSQYSGKSSTCTEHSDSGKDLTGALFRIGREGVDDTAAVSAEREVCLQAPSQVSSAPPVLHCLVLSIRESSVVWRGMYHWSTATDQLYGVTHRYYYTVSCITIVSEVLPCLISSYNLFVKVLHHHLLLSGSIDLCSIIRLSGKVPSRNRTVRTPHTSHYSWIITCLKQKVRKKIV